MDVPLKELLNIVGHDGSEIAWPHLPEPMRRRAFHPGECISAAYSLGFACTEFDLEARLSPDGSNIIDVKINMPLGVGVAYGRPKGKFLRHAIAVSGWTAYDPNGTSYDLQNHFRTERFWAIDLIRPK